MTNLPSNAFSLEWKNGLTALGMVIIAAFITSFMQALGLSSEGNITAPHIPNKAEIIKALIAGLGAGIAYIFRKYFKNDVPGALELVQKAQEEKVKKLNNPTI